jgi:hypothetical protein
MALISIKRLILSIDGASIKLNSYVFRLHFERNFLHELKLKGFRTFRKTILTKAILWIARVE